MDAIVWGGVMIITVLVLIFMVPRLLGKSGAQASDLLSSTRDYDGDGVADFFDKCACVSGDEKNEGCPINEITKGQAAIDREKKCKEEIMKKK